MRKLLIANRGEIAVRIIRAARDLGIATVAVYSDADVGSLHTQMADESVNIGPAVASKSYLNVRAILKAAKDTEADAIHPGYGFLAENAAFAAACAEAEFIFVGPTPDAIARMGDKALARSTAAEVGVPTVPGSLNAVHELDEVLAVAEQCGYPIMIKAAAGGGGRGIRVAEDADELHKLLPIAQREAHAAFGDGAVYLERFIHDARHVEVQVLGDGERVVHFFERECSLQRRRQKVVEEALSPVVTPKLRKAMTEAAVRLAESVGYRGAGTLEFLVDAKTREFFFIEMNTRIQVEHPVTEMVCGVDLVHEQIHLAAGDRLRLQQKDIHARGWAIECRINAENPEQNFMPSPGVIHEIELPAGPWVRVDTHIYTGYTVPPFYDSLLAKLIVWGPTRGDAIGRASRALREFHIDGIHTTAPLLRRIMERESFVKGDFHTGSLEHWVSQTS